MFSQYLHNVNLGSLFSRLDACSANDVAMVLAKPKARIDDLPVLLSEAAGDFVYAMAQKALSITRQRFGNTIQLYIPLYVSNKCAGTCVYCGFRSSNPIQRETISFDQAMAESKYIHQKGFRNLLLVSGCTDDLGHDQLLQRLIENLSKQFTSVSVEIEPLQQDQYKKLVACGLDGVTLYQETYHPEAYRAVHPSGPKSDYDHRLDVMDQAGAAGVRKLGLGVLLGLYDFRQDACLLGIHTHYLMQRYWRSAVAISFPRIRECESDFQIPYPVSDKQLAQMVFAFRLVFPDNDLNLSTREPPQVRDFLAKTAITYMSAGSRTNPGGYITDQNSLKQFELEDQRSVEEVCAVLQDSGLDVVWKDWNGYNGKG